MMNRNWNKHKPLPETKENRENRERHDAAARRRSAEKAALARSAVSGSNAQVSLALEDKDCWPSLGSSNPVPLCPVAVVAGPAAEDVGASGASLGDCSEDEEMDPSDGLSGPGLDGDVDTGGVEAIFSDAPGAPNAKKVFVEMPKPKAPWVDLFRDNRGSSNGLTLSAHGGVGVRPVLVAEDIDDVVEKWGFALGGYIAGKGVNKGAIIRLCSSWKVEFNVQFLECGWVLIRFTKEEDKSKALAEGLMIQGQPFILKDLADGCDLGNEEVSKVPMWVRLPNLPSKFWNDVALGKILSYIGLPLRTDKFTMTKEKRAYARAFVEVDVSLEIKNNVVFDLPNNKFFDQRIHYEFVPKFCEACKAIGHDLVDCPRSPKSPVPSDEQQPEPMVEVPVHDGLGAQVLSEPPLVGTEFVAAQAEPLMVGTEPPAPRVAIASQGGPLPSVVAAGPSGVIQDELMDGDAPAHVGAVPSLASDGVSSALSRPAPGFSGSEPAGLVPGPACVQGRPVVLGLKRVEQPKIVKKSNKKKVKNRSK